MLIASKLFRDMLLKNEYGGNRFIDSFPKPIHWLRALSDALLKGTLLQKAAQTGGQ
jgi:hypothetical protein